MPKLGQTGVRTTAGKFDKLEDYLKHRDAIRRGSSSVCLWCRKPARIYRTANHVVFAIRDCVDKNGARRVLCRQFRDFS